MKRVRISYSPQLDQVNKVRELDDDEAAALVAEGRGAYVQDEAVIAERSKAELLDRANALGLDVSERDSKASLAAAITRAESGQG